MGHIYVTCHLFRGCLEIGTILPKLTKLHSHLLTDKSLGMYMCVRLNEKVLSLSSFIEAADIRKSTG